MRRSCVLALATFFVLAVLDGAVTSFGSEGGSAGAIGQWRHYAADHASTRHSPLDQIDAENVKNLGVAWRWESPDAELDKTQRLGQGMFKPTPIMVNGVLYVSTSYSQVAAIDAATGKTKWVYNTKSTERGRPTNSGFQHRGVEYWSDGKDERILIATGGRQLVAVNAKTGQPYPDFGKDGWVDLDEGLGREINPRVIAYNSPVIVCRDTVVVGSIVFDYPMMKEMTPGHVRGYDVRTGKMKWIFHTIAQGGEPGVETWENDSWKYTGNTNVWTSMSCDDELGYVYLPTSTPTNDHFGGHRLGNNLYAESIVCVKADTGERVWHFQAVHHGLWDYDFPCSPNLVDITVDGKKIKALAQVSKQGFTYVLDRVTGKPVWPIEERPVPASTTPGEKASPTQPFPTKPPAFDRQGITEDDLIDFTPELRAEAKKIVSEYVIGPLFTPPSVIGKDGKKGTLILPSAAGGANWGGAALDPETGVLYVPSMALPTLLGLSKPDPNRSDFDYMRTGSYLVPGPTGLPLIKPPYGRITAIDLNKGDIIWQVAHGDGPRDNPAIKDLKLPPLGAAANGALSNGGGIVTKTLYFAIQSTVDESSMMRIGKEGFVRAFSKKDGKVVWEKLLTTSPHGTPMTYLAAGKQFLVLSAGGMGQKSELIAFALP